MSGTFVNAAHASNDSAGTTLTVSYTATSGNLLACSNAFNDRNTAGSVADGGTNTYTAVGTAVDNPNFYQQDSFYAKNITGGALSIVFTTPSAPYRRAQVAEYSGLDTTAPLDDHAEGLTVAAGGTDACTSGNGAGTSVAGDLIVSFFINLNSATNPTAGTNFTLHDIFTNAAGDASAVEERTQSASGVPDAGVWTSNDGACLAIMTMMAFKVAAGGGSAVQVSSDGAATANFADTSTSAQTISAAGAATANFVEQSTNQQTVGIAGVGTAAFADTSTSAQTISSAGAATANFGAVSTTAQTVSIAGVATATFGETSTSAQAISAAGAATANFTATSTTTGAVDFSSSGVSTANFSAQSSVKAALSVTGAATANFGATQINPVSAPADLRVVAGATVRFGAKQTGGARAAIYGPRPHVYNEEEEILSILAMIAPLLSRERRGPIRKSEVMQ